MNVDQKPALFEKIRTEISNRYVFPEVGDHVSRELEQLWLRGNFSNDHDANQFAEHVTSELRRLSNDSHIRVRYSEEAHVEPAENDVVREQNDRKKHCEQLAFGIQRVERLPQNIGYIDIREFVELSLAAPTVSAALTLVANADALIIDLRKCVGGDPTTVAWLASYLFDRRTQLCTFVLRDESKSEQFWTSEWVANDSLAKIWSTCSLQTSRFRALSSWLTTYKLADARRWSAKLPAVERTRAICTGSIHTSICSCLNAAQ